MALLLAPTLVKCAQVYAQIDERPLGSHVIGSSHGPSPKSVVLFDLPKMPLNDPSTPGKSFLSLKGFYALTHLLHGCGVTPGFNHSTPFGVLAQVRHRAVLHVAALPDRKSNRRNSST